MRDPALESSVPLMGVPTAGSRHFGQLLAAHKGKHYTQGLALAHMGNRIGHGFSAVLLVKANLPPAVFPYSIHPQIPGSQYLRIIMHSS